MTKMATSSQCVNTSPANSLKSPNDVWPTWQQAVNVVTHHQSNLHNAPMMYEKMTSSINVNTSPTKSLKCPNDVWHKWPPAVNVLTHNQPNLWNTPMMYDKKWPPAVNVLTHHQSNLWNAPIMYDKNDHQQWLCYHITSQISEMPQWCMTKMATSSQCVNTSQAKSLKCPNDVWHKWQPAVNVLTYHQPHL